MRIALLLLLATSVYAQGPPTPGGGGTNATPTYAPFVPQAVEHGAIKTASMTTNSFGWWNHSNTVFNVNHRSDLTDGSWTNIGDGYNRYLHNDHSGFYCVTDSGEPIIPPLPEPPFYDLISCGADFNPPVTNTVPHTSAPAIAEWCRTANRGQSITLTGENLTTNFIGFGHGSVNEIIAFHLDGQEAAIKMPADLPMDEMYFIWPSNSYGYGAAIAINKTEAWWATHSVSTGSIFTVYGQSLALGGGNTTLYIEELELLLTNSAGNPYKAEFIIPAGISNGTYDAYAHNGHGGKYGWADPVELNVVAANVWTGSTVTVSGNDSDAIDDAMDACPVNGTVYFPDGTYYLSRQLKSIGTHKRILGESRDGVIIKPHSSFPTITTASGLIDGQNSYVMSNVEFRNLTIHDDGYNKGKLFYNNGTAEKIWFINCKLSQVGSDAVYSSGSPSTIDVRLCDYFKMEDCIIEAKFSVRNINSTGSIFKDCSFYGLDDCAILLENSASRDLVITGCTGTHYDKTVSDGWCQGRFIYGAKDGAMRNAYIGENSTTNMTTRVGAPEMNTGEQIMFEGRYVGWRGYASTSTANTVTCPGLGGVVFPTAQLTIVAGKGYGQAKTITALSTSTGIVTVKEPWLVRPDSTSVVTIGRHDYHVVVHGNSLDGIVENWRDDVYVNTASAAVSFYGGHSKCVIANNTASDVESGFINWGMSSVTPNSGGKEWAEPAYFNTVIGNSVDGCDDAFADWGFHGVSGTHEADACIVGTLWRDNICTNVDDSAHSHGTDVEEMETRFVMWDGEVQ